MQFTKAQVHYMMDMLIEGLGGLPEKNKVEFWETMAKKLSDAIAAEKPWTWRYPQGVYQGTTSPSEKFVGAMMALGATMTEEVPAVLVNTVEYRVRARSGTLENGVVILGKMKVCRRPGCPVKFVPKVPNQSYCSRECREQAVREKRDAANRKKETHKP